MPAQPPALRHISSYLRLRDVERYMAPQELVLRVKRHPWRAMFLALAQLAAIAAHDGNLLSPRVQERTVGALLEAGRIVPDAYGNVAAGLAREPGRPIAHESVIYYLQALALLYGTDSNTDYMPWAELAYLMLAANEFVDDWADDDPALSLRERNLANTTRAMLFNRNMYRVAALIRGCEMLREPPPRAGPLHDEATWRDLQRRAFGMDLDTYVETLAAPLVVSSIMWGRDGEKGIVLPQIAAHQWLSPTSASPELGSSFLAELAWTRARAIEELGQVVDARGLVRAPAIFYRRPFVWLDDRNVTAASPWVVVDQIRSAIWARHLAASKETLGDGRGAKAWFGAFGDLFELWCRRTADLAMRALPKTALRLVHSTLGSADEIEDVVFVDRRSVVLVSAKASALPERILKAATTQSAVRDWYEKFFFAAGDSEYRGGAIRLLDKKVRQIREQPDARLPSRPNIYPMIVTWDRLCTDNPGFTRWLEGRCQAEGLLANCEPLTVLQIDDFEELMAIVAHGHDLVRLLEQKLSPEWRHARLANFLRTEVMRDATELRLPGSDAALDEIIARIQSRLFGVR